MAAFSPTNCFFTLLIAHFVFMQPGTARQLFIFMLEWDLGVYKSLQSNDCVVTEPCL